MTHCACAHIFSLSFLFLEIDRVKYDMCDITNMVIDLYNIMFEINNRGETLCKHTSCYGFWG